ncbi:SDR family NAD(P)-dependent oxidoreductase [Amycolatopsis suaedae]|uniref:SDR family NAD(P)-dependent oxidoreductase n=1 Tax=Amycolatopsis suaedae TaxID=2510978 RepID=A0A4Q7IZS4_9PSEU|nr:SDR family NAD(P)-dependent oxidoreductase [Amycolatopsis suaedae]RZQ59772.1 SDR family NAD(P)-dependent oxidoreductase [Amycolatopsis suaedae]
MATLAIFGAGPGLGLATARRFGQEGFDVALVARSRERLEGWVRELAAEGVRARALPADLTDRSAHAELVRAIGPVDVAVLNGYVERAAIRPVLDIDPDSMSAVIDGAVLAPLSLTRLLLPGMLERGEGGLLYGLGGSAHTPMPPMAALGSAQASLRNYVLNLHIELAGRGVYAGALTIAALIENSDAQRLFDSDPAATLGLKAERVDPADLAQRYWDLYSKRDRAEDTVGALLAA